MPKEINLTDKNLNTPLDGDKPEVIKENQENTEIVEAEKVETQEVVKEEPEKEESTPETKDPKVIDKKTEDVKVSEVATKKKKKKFPIWIFFVIGFLLITGIGLFYYFGIYKVKPYVKPSDIINLNSEYLMSEGKPLSFLNFLVTQPEEPKTEESPLNGLLFTKSQMNELTQRRAVAVMINNHAVARPQSGLNSADIVYEALAESGITRYMAIFWSEAPAKVGPIRSARQYYLEWLSPLNALYIHDGCASTDNPKTNACGNIYTYGIKDISTIGAWRWNDGRRFAPHNEYSSVTNAWEYAQKMDWTGLGSFKSWSFKNDADVQDRGLKSKIEIVFHERLNNGGYYDTTWTYDPKTNTYLKTTGNQPDLDQETNTQVYAKNLVVQEIEMSASYDDKGRIILDAIGKGNAIYLIDGKIVEGTWKKSSRTERTVYLDSDGKEIEFNRGRIWISVVPRTEGKFAIIEQ